MAAKPDRRCGSLFPDTDSSSTWRAPELRPLPSGITDLGYDFETRGLEWWKPNGAEPIGLALAWREGNEVRKWYLPTGHAGGNIDIGRVVEWVKTELRGKRLFGNALRFDAHAGRHSKWRVDHETLGNRLCSVDHLAALLDDHREKFDLDSIASDYLGRKKNLGNLDIERLAEYHAGKVAGYAENDAELALLLGEKMLPMIHAEGLDAVQHLEEKVLFAVVEMEKNGSPMDRELLRQWLIDSERDYARLIFELKQLTGHRFDKVNSAAEAERALHGVGLEVLYRIARGAQQGQPSFTDAIFDQYEILIKTFQLKPNCDPAKALRTIELLRTARKLASVRSKYLLPYDKTLRDTDGIMRYALHQLRGGDAEEEGGTVTGRFSCTGFKINGKVIGRNVQQVPTPEKMQEFLGDDYMVRRLYTPEYAEEIRYQKFLEAYIDDTGASLIREHEWPIPLQFKTDAMQIEYRLIAHYMKDPNIIAAYKKNPKTNFHKLVATWIHQFNPEVPYKVIKNTNFCEAFGGGYKKVAATAGILEEHARKFVEIYDDRMPGVKILLRKCSDRARQVGFVKTLLGRRARFKENCACRGCTKYADRGPRYYKALNGVIQGSAADIMKTKLVLLHETRKETGLILRFTVHDEADGQVPNLESARKVAALLNQQDFDLRVPILWETSIGPNWADVVDIESLTEAA